VHFNEHVLVPKTMDTENRAPHSAKKTQIVIHPRMGTQTASGRTGITFPPSATTLAVSALQRHVKIK